jgi:hypothetical protein
LLNEIYQVMRLYKNYFLPAMRLTSKTRVEGRIRRKYDASRTAYQRVMASREVLPKQKQELKAIYEGLNPAELNRKLTQLRSQLEKISSGKLEGNGAGSFRGPDIRISRRRNPAVQAA